MTRSYVFLLSLLAAVWGSGYLLIKIALEGFEPTTMMTIRLGVSVVLLVGVLGWRGELAAVRRVPRGDAVPGSAEEPHTARVARAVSANLSRVGLVAHGCLGGAPARRRAWSELIALI